METDATRMCALLVGLPDVVVVGGGKRFLQFPGGDDVTHLRTARDRQLRSIPSHKGDLSPLLGGPFRERESLPTRGSITQVPHWVQFFLGASR